VGDVIVNSATITLKDHGGGVYGSANPSVALDTPDLVLDGFETGDLTAPNSGDGVNTIGFSWDSTNGTSIANKTTVIYNFSGVVSIPLVNPDPDDWDPQTGDNSFRVYYGPADDWSEQRFDTTTPQTSLYVGYWIMVPTNYTRVNDGPQNNNKWFDIFWGNIAGWPTDYSNSNLPRLEMQDIAGSAGACNMQMQVRQQGAGTIQTSSSHSDFITEADAGRWMHCMYYLGESSGTDVADAEVKFWRRWEDDAGYTLICSLDSLVIQNTVGEGVNGWSGGYLMGFLNDPFVDASVWMIDDFSWWSTDPTSGVLP